MTTTTSNAHIAVWLDHQEARVFHIAADSFDEKTLESPRHHVKRHPDKNAAEKNHPEDAKRFFQEIVEALGATGEILIVGPSTAKLQFLNYVHSRVPSLATRIIGIETVDHPTDKQLAAYARHYFHGVDRMRGLVP